MWKVHVAPIRAVNGIAACTLHERRNLAGEITDAHRLFRVFWVWLFQADGADLVFRNLGDRVEREVLR